jgi:hypothetical protein
LFPSAVVTVIVAVPADLASTFPPSDTVATEELLVVQLTVLFVALLGLTVAVRVSDPPAVRERLVLFRLTLVTGTAAAATVTAQVAFLFPSDVVTVIVAVPADTAVTVPSSTVATLELLVVQLTVLFVALLGLTVSVRVSDPPAVKERLVLLRLTLVTGTAAATTVKAQVAVLFPSTVVTVIVAVPTDTAVTVPLDTVATAELLVAQFTFLFVASPGLTVALRVPFPPTARERLVLFRLTPLTETTADATVTVQVAVLLPSAVVTVIVAVPGDFAVTVPPDTVATAELLVVQLTFLFVALLGLTVAVRVSK